MRAIIPAAVIALGACAQPKPPQPSEISCGFKNVGSVIVAADVRSSLPVPPEARDPVSFELEGKLDGAVFTGKLINFRRPGSDVIYQEDIRGPFDQAAQSLSFKTKDGSLKFSIWPHSDPPDQEGSRAMLIGDLNELETASLFVGACGFD